jgi:hypothetical protein
MRSSHLYEHTLTCMAIQPMTRSVFVSLRYPTSDAHRSRAVVR